MFRRIHRRYDLLNGLISLGQDQRWRRKAVARLDPPAHSRILDVGAGTGDLSGEVLRQQPTGRVVALDFTREMMLTGRQRHPQAQISWVQADAEALPFKDGSFQGVISGFLLRNVSDLDRTLREQHRVLMADQRMVCLEGSSTGQSVLNPLVRFHYRQVIPTLGAFLARDRGAYEYLTRSMEGFLESLRKWTHPVFPQ